MIIFNEKYVVNEFFYLAFEYDETHVYIGDTFAPYISGDLNLSVTLAITEYGNLN